MPDQEGRRKRDSARLHWDSKPRRAPNPKDIEFQTAEVVIPNPQAVDTLPFSFKDGLLNDIELDKQKMNRLIWGDNLLAMQALLANGYEGRIDLIYIDPPFDSKADYSYKVEIEGHEFVKEPSVIERLAYTDTWAGGLDSYLDMLYPRLHLMKRLLKDTGSIYVHLDWHAGHYVKVMMDEIFGRENFVNQIIWRKTNSPKAQSKGFGTQHDMIYIYAKSLGTVIFNKIYRVLDEKALRPYSYEDEGGKFRLIELEAQGIQRSAGRRVFEFRGRVAPWLYSLETLEKWWEEGLIYKTKHGRYTKKQYLEEVPGLLLSDIWVDDEVSPLQGSSKEFLAFDTQKPTKLLERIILASSIEGDLVADFFCGSGTTLAVAERLGRRWIGCDIGKVGIQITRGRLVEMGARPFLIENIGNYQREMIYLSGSRIWEIQRIVLKLYGATPRDKERDLGVRRAEDGTDELVYVGYPDRPITAKKAVELAAMAEKLDGRGYKRLVILGWDYEYNYQEALEAQLKARKDKLGVKIESRDIPPEIYDYLRTSKSEDEIEAIADKIYFHERPYLKLEGPVVKELKGEEVEITLKIAKYVLMDIPLSKLSKGGKASEKAKEAYEQLLRIAKDNFAVLIDYWAIDWDYDGVTFKSQWQALRGHGKKIKPVPTEARVRLSKKKRTIAVRVVDIFGNDAAAIVELG